MENNFSSTHVTMAQAVTNEGQSLVAFNDLFIGPASHTSARHKISFDSQTETRVQVD
ncbi:MAG: hypothetical protein IPJ20_23620 [Flammeovirgaceae bacterium]|nr:hypothetical protein [Flammeovirgaceae bacterium]